jgi:hypothetical protein
MKKWNLSVSDLGSWGVDALKGCGPGSNLEEPAAFIIQFWRVSDSDRVFFFFFFGTNQRKPLIAEREEYKYKAPQKGAPDQDRTSHDYSGLSPLQQGSSFSPFLTQSVARVATFSS